MSSITGIDSRMARTLAACAAALLFILAAVPMVSAQADQTEQRQGKVRKVKEGKPPDYPELARKMNLHGVARVLATVAPDGKVVGVKEAGGHPVLVSALAEAVKKWRYEPAERESLVEVKFEFK